jgi:hypothetical protein
MPKFPIIGLLVIVASLIAGCAGKVVWDVHNDFFVAGFLVLVGLLGIIAGGSIMHWGAVRR